MTNFNELQEETREIITDLLNDGSDPDALLYYRTSHCPL